MDVWIVSISVYKQFYPTLNRWLFKEGIVKFPSRDRDDRTLCVSTIPAGYQFTGHRPLVPVSPASSPPPINRHNQRKLTTININHWPQSITIFLKVACPKEPIYTSQEWEKNVHPISWAKHRFNNRAKYDDGKSLLNLCILNQDPVISSLWVSEIWFVYL